MSIGSFCLVLHGHMPYVLRHGKWPHGEDWLYEAAAETYLPILGVIDECQFLNGNPRLTIGLTPVLLEQLSHSDFKRGFSAYLQSRIERARADEKDFQRQDQPHLAYLATRWQQYYADLAGQFADIEEDIPKAFAEKAEKGFVQILTSNATHGYMPLLLEDSSIRAQIRAGLASSRRILGLPTRGMWLPECAYRPEGHWTPPISWGNIQARMGIDRIAAEEGITHFFIESHLINGQGWGWEDRHHHDNGMTANEPYWVNRNGHDAPSVAALIRDPQICKQVWSGDVGYPGDGVYLEFHKRLGEGRGLRYWKVTNRKLGLGEKDMYHPDDVPGKIFEHVQHFCNQIKHRLHEHRNRTGRPGVVVACFDAELFGHWWFEGPQFLRDVLLSLNADPDVDLCTTEEYITHHPPEKTAWPAEGSWGDGGDHRVWSNPGLGWMWEIEYRCESLFGKWTYQLPWRENPQLEDILKKAGRELLLLQASDWPFVITRNQAQDYGIRRFMQHVIRFETLIDTAEHLAKDPKYLDTLSEVQRFDIQDADIHDVIFPEIDLNWWNM